MKRLFVLAACVWLTTPLFAQDTDVSPLASPAATPTAFDAPEVVQQYQATITPEDLAAHLFFFASDFFEGRETATEGQKMAAHYLAAQYRKLGVAPAGTVEAAHRYAPEAYFQPFPVYGRRLEEARLDVLVDSQVVGTQVFSPTQFGEDAYLVFGTTPEASAGIVFGGYGIADDERGYNDYAALGAAGLSQVGQWLMILPDEPLADAETSRLTADGSLSPWTTTNNSLKMRTLFQTGLPAGILIVGDVGPRMEDTIAEQAAEAAQAQMGMGDLSLNEQGGGFAFPPIYVISEDFADRLLAPAGRTIAQVQAEIDEAVKPVVFAVPGTTLRSQLTFDSFEASSENVLAFIEGSDPVLKDEVVVISSHYDHIGLDPSNEEDPINNGADDDGSGTVALLEIAEAFMQAKADGVGPRRSLLFLHVSGEEKGLLGSAYYADTEPVFPLENTVTNLNIDMIGRVDPTHPGADDNYVYIIGSNLISQELHDINLKINELGDTTLDLNERFNSKDDPNQFYRRSDHWNFGKHSIPFIFFFTGTHDDYHGVDDEPDRIEYDRMARIARLIFGTAWQVANQDARPAVSGEGFN